MKTNIRFKILIEKPTDLKVRNQYPAYAVKSDDGKKTEKEPISWPMLLKAMMAEVPKKNQYPAYAVKSDDGENEEH